MFGLDIKFDGSDEKNLTTMLFFIMYEFGLDVQFTDHWVGIIGGEIQEACKGLKLIKEGAIAKFYKR